MKSYGIIGLEQFTFQSSSTDHGVLSSVEQLDKNTKDPTIFPILSSLLPACSVASFMTDSLWAYGLWPTRLPCPWDSLQARVLEWAAMPSSRGPSQPRDWSRISTLKANSLLLSHQGSPIICPTTTQLLSSIFLSLLLRNLLGTEPRLFINIILFIYLILSVLGLCCCAWAFSSCGEGATVRCGKQPSHCSGFSCCRVQILGTWASAAL